MKGQINLEFLASAFVFLLAIGTLLTIGSDILPNFSDGIDTSTIHMEAYTVSTNVLSSTGSTASGDLDWETSDTSINNIENFGLSESNDDYLVIDQGKLENITGFEYGTTGTNVNYSEFKSLTGVQNQYYFNFTWMPVFYSSKKVSAVENPTLDDDLVLWYEMENKSGAINDSSSNSNDGVNNGAERTVRGVFDSGGIRFDGNNDYVDTSPFYSNAQNTSVSYWAYFPNKSQNDDVRVFQIGGTSSSRPNDGYAHINNPSGSGNDILNVSHWSGGSVSTSNSFDIKRGSWNHIVQVIEDDTTHVYINNEKRGQFSSDTGPDPIEPLTLGAGDSNYWEGRLDEFRIYNRTLSSSEVSDLYTIESKIVRPELGFTSSNRQYIYGFKKFENENNYFLITGSDSAYVSDDWNFSGSQKLDKGSDIDINGTEFSVNDVEKNTVGGYIGLRNHLKGFGPNRDSDSTVIKIQRFGVMKGEPIRIEVFAW